MKILLTTDTVGGVWTYCIDIARGLAPLGAQIVLATMGATLSADQRAQVASLSHVTVLESEFKLEWMNDPWQDVERAGIWLLEIERQFQPHVVHLNSYAYGDLPFNAPVVMVGHSCVCSWWEACRGEAAPPEWNRYRERVRNGINGAGVLVAPTNAMLEALRRHYSPTARSEVIANGRTARLYQSRTAKEPIILSAGRLWDEAKNLAALNEAAAGLPWPAFVAGEACHPEGGHTATGAAMFLGKLSEAELAAWYARAQIYVLPARYEPFGLSVLEAALSGCALVLGDIASLRENWEGAAEFVHPQDTGELRTTLRRLIDNPDRRQSLANRALHRAARFGLSKCADAYFSLYRTVSSTRSFVACGS